VQNNCAFLLSSSVVLYSISAIANFAVDTAHIYFADLPIFEKHKFEYCDRRVAICERLRLFAAGERGRSAVIQKIVL
jgi:hypothetical protein